jgi:GT2 family glycosyltransferase
MPQVSAIIVNYNAGKALRDAISSVLDSHCVKKVFVVDNNSVDHSMDDIKYFVETESRLVCIYNRSNLGFAKACNIAVRKAESDYLFFLNPDCILNPGALEKMLRYMIDRKSVAVVGPHLINTDGSEQAGGRRAVPTPWRSFVRAFGLSRMSNRYPRLFSDYNLHQQSLPGSPVEIEAISGSCMLVRRAALEEVGLLDEEYFLHCEDLDWCMRFRQREWKILFVPSARVMHYKGLCSQGRPIFVEWHKHKGMLRFYRKFFRHQYPNGLMWLVTIGVWLRFGMVTVNHGFRRIKDRMARNRK